jgi:predicted transcriptional regulator
MATKRIVIDIVDSGDQVDSLDTAVRRADDGEGAPGRAPRLRFSSLAQLHSSLTEKRLVLLRYVAGHEGLNTRRLAIEIGRDYKNVHADVDKLCKFGLIEKRDGALYAPYDELTARYTLRRFSSSRRP